MRWSDGAGRWPLVRWCWFLVADALMVAGAGRCWWWRWCAGGRCLYALAYGGRWPLVVLVWPVVAAGLWCWFMCWPVLIGASRVLAGLSGSTGALWWPLVLVALMAADVLVVRW